MYFPGGHVAHAAPPLENLPAVQDVHADDAVVVVDVPLAHVRQAVEPGDGAYVPFPHAKHDMAAVELPKLPAAHGVHCPAVQYVPTGHGAHDVLLVPPGVHWPGSQHSAAPATALKVLVAHDAHGVAPPGEKCDGVHAVQLASPLALLYWPGGHVVHVADDDVLAYCPTAHGEHGALPLEYCPGGHAEHTPPVSEY